MSTIDVTSEAWEEEVEKAEKPVVVDFWHEQCVWCKRLDPEYEELSEVFEGEVKFVKMDILASEENQKIAHRNGVMGTPTLKFYCGGRSVGEFVGYAPKAKLRGWINNMIEDNEDCLAQSSPIRLSPYG